jgi:hypothetical protein
MVQTAIKNTISKTGQVFKCIVNTGEHVPSKRNFLMILRSDASVPRF